MQIFLAIAESSPNPIPGHYTPFVFVNDRLYGWGWPNLQTAAARYEFVIKHR